MPSHYVHQDIISKCTNINVETASKLDKIIDLGEIHDLGRRSPKKPPTYLLLYDEYKQKYMNKIKKINNILENILLDNNSCRAFYIHHALDILSLRLASAAALKVSIEDACYKLSQDVINCDIVPIKNKVKGNCSYNIFKYLHEVLLCACRQKSLYEWVFRIVDEKTRFLNKNDYKKDILNILDKINKSSLKYENSYIMSILSISAIRSKFSNKKDKKITIKLNDITINLNLDDISSLESAKEEINKHVKNKKIKSKYYENLIKRKIVELAAKYSGLYDLINLTNCNDIIRRKVLSIKQKDYSFIKLIINCFKIKNKDERQRCLDKESDKMMNYIKINLVINIDNDILYNIKIRFIRELEIYINYLEDLNIKII